MDRVSVIIPIYNSEKYLSRCLESVIYQEYIDLEIILVNDGSTDNSLSICKKYADVDERIYIIDGENYGVSYARNKGLELASGKYVLFIDADDRIEKNYISCLVKYMNRENLDLVICGYKDINMFLNIKKEFLLKAEEKQLLTGIFNEDFYLIRHFMDTPWSKIYRMDIIKSNDISFPEKMKVAEDQVFNYQYYSNVKRYKFINKSLYNYIHNENISLTQVRNIETFNCELENIALKKEFLKKEKIKFEKQILTEYILYRINIYVFVEEKKENIYYKSKNRIKKLKENISFSYKGLNLKRRIQVFFLKCNIYFPIYLNIKLKLFRGIRL